MYNMNNLINDEKAVLVSVIKSITAKCKTEGENQALTVPINEPENRITYYTGLSHNTITQILSNKLKLPTIDLNSRISLHDVIKCMYVQEGSLDYPGLFKEASKAGLNRITGYRDKFISNLPEFIEEMILLGYESKQSIDNSTIIIENPDIRFERFKYLNKMKKIRNNTSNKQLVYIDERIVSIDQNFPKIWPTVKLTNDCETDLVPTIFYHAVSKTGLVSGLYSNQATHEDFCKWVKDMLLVNLKEPSIIILDNNPLHGVPQNACPITKYHSKKDMLKWLTKNHIPCSSTMNKPALYELVKKFSNNTLEYKIDSIIRSQGHEVMRLPHPFYDLSITTPLWEYIVQTKTHNTNSKKYQFVLPNSLIVFISNIGLTLWNQFDKFVESKEREIFNIDVSIDSIVDNYDLILD